MYCWGCPGRCGFREVGTVSGLYSCFAGRALPLEGIGPQQLKIKALEERLANNNIKEIILALNPTIEGEATALYISKRIKNTYSGSLTRLAHGLPIGADLEYADEITLARAFEGRREIITW